MASTDKGTFGVKGLPVPEDVQRKTDETDENNIIPYVTGMPMRYDITDFWQRMDKSKDLKMQMQWTLFIKGLERFKALPVDERLSYFQVAGIHGFPTTSWDGAPDPRKAPEKPKPGDNPQGGYCHHNAVSFPMFHRPYLLLFEQCIWLNMLEIIRQWSASPNPVISQEDAVAWTEAANTWRLFYWDWARKQKYPGEKSWDDFGIPYLFTLPDVQIFPPKGEDSSCPNPLYNFENPEKDSSGKPLPFGQMPANKAKWNITDSPPNKKNDWDVPLPWSKCSATSRWGILYDRDTRQFSGLEGKNEWEHVNLALSTAGARFYKPPRGDPDKKEDMKDLTWKLIRPKNLADAVNRMFCGDYNGEWSTFSSTKWYAEKASNIITGYLSLEYIHNNVHSITGGASLGWLVGHNPHEKEPPDTDRAVIYGAGHMCDVPVAAFDPIFWMHHCNIDRYAAMWQCLNWGKWFEEEPKPADGQEAHVPDIKPTDLLHPFHKEDGGSPNDEKNVWTSNCARDWTKLGYQYDDLVPNDHAVVGGKINPDIYKADLRAYIHKIYPGTSYQASSIWRSGAIVNKDFFGPGTAERGEFEDYLINVVYDRYALDGRSYSIVFYIDDDYVGHIFSLGGMPPGVEVGCANCGNQQNAKVLSKGQVPISIALMRIAADPATTGLNKFTADVVEPYLAKNLTMRYYEGKKIIDPKDFPNTQVTVIGGKGRWSKLQRGGETVQKDGEDVYKTPVYDAGSYMVLDQATVNLRPPTITALDVKLPQSSAPGTAALDQIAVQV